MYDTLTSILRTAGGAVGTESGIGTNNIDFSELVKLRAAHETLQARNSVRNSTRATKSTEDAHSIDEPSDFRQARKEIVQKFHQLLRDADAEKERVGTGLHRSHMWAGESGNALNAAKVAEDRAKEVRDSVSQFHRCGAMLTIRKATDKRRNVFAGITLAQQPGGVPILSDAGISKLYPLVCKGEGGEGWKGSSWGFVFTNDRIVLSNGMWRRPVQIPLLMPHIPVMAIYKKMGGKNGKYSWVPSITNVSSATTLHVQLFRHMFRDRYSQTHNYPVPGIN